MKISNLNKFLYLFFSFTLLLGFYLGEDSSGSGGFISDFFKSMPFVKDPFNFETHLGLGKIDNKFPLHYVLVSFIYDIWGRVDLFRLTYCVISIFCPLLFFYCLKMKFKKVNQNYLFLFSLIILILPSFRSGAIWPNTQVTAIFFFLASILFLLKWENNKLKIINKDLILSLFFLSLAVYTRQLYALIFFYYLYLLFTKLNLKNFLIVLFIILIFAIPSLYFIYKIPSIITFWFAPKVNFSTNIFFFNTVLINLSIMSFYLSPLYLILLLNNKLKIKLNNSSYFIIIFILLLAIIFFSLFFNYNYKMGGGFLMKVSIYFFNNLYFFYLTSFLGLIFLYSLARENTNNLVLILILLLGFTTHYIFQKYFEPMFIILLFTLFKTNLTVNFFHLEKNIYYLYIYYFLYLAAAITNDIMQISKTI